MFVPHFFIHESGEEFLASSKLAELTEYMFRAQFIPYITLFPFSYILFSFRPFTSFNITVQIRFQFYVNLRYCCNHLFPHLCNLLPQI